MATRRNARECIIKILYQLDLNHQDIDTIFPAYWERKGSLKDLTLRSFVETAVLGVINNIKELDTLISKAATNWNVLRMAVIDRNVLRLALYEMFYCDDIPIPVSINEAVDIAKYFNDNKSGKFVNGILDNIRKDIDAKQGGAE